jgi:hypothetical protein
LNLTETEMVSIFCVSDITGMFGNWVPKGYAFGSYVPNIDYVWFVASEISVRICKGIFGF